MLWANNKFSNCKGKSPFMGQNTRNLFVAPNPTVKLYTNRFNKYFPNDTIKENAQSNGPLMRAYPLAFVEDESLIRTDVGITNPSELCYNAVFVYVRAIKLAIIGKTKDEIRDAVRPLISHQPLKIAFEQACSGTFRNVTVSRGHIVHGFYCAFWGLFQFNDYKSAIDAIICLSPKPNELAKICVPGRWKKKRGRGWGYRYKCGNCGCATWCLLRLYSNVYEFGYQTKYSNNQRL